VTYYNKVLLYLFEINNYKFLIRSALNPEAEYFSNDIFKLIGSLWILELISLKKWKKLFPLLPCKSRFVRFANRDNRYRAE
jgi:hypothetical protein